MTGIERIFCVQISQISESDQSFCVFFNQHSCLCVTSH